MRRATKDEADTITVWMMRGNARPYPVKIWVIAKDNHERQEWYEAGKRWCLTEQMLAHIIDMVAERFHPPSTWIV